MTVEQWLDELINPKQNKEIFCGISLLSAPSTILRRLFSAALFVKVLQSAFMGKRGLFDGDSKRSLSGVLVDGAIDFLKSRNCEVQMDTSVERVDTEGDLVARVVLSSGETFRPEL